MEIRGKANAYWDTIRNIGLFAVLCSFVLIVNLPIVAFDMMYAEQPMLYTANQAIHSLSDLFNIYLHPKMLQIFTIPFFRPSGHFLIYQLIMPFLGWHNTQGLVVTNLLFLAMTGYLAIKLYPLLFPRFKIGGYIAFSIYLMHPSLMLSRLIVLHFEFAYVFFLMLSLYAFVLFCQKNSNKMQLVHFSLLAYALFFYTIAVTFKEPAIMLGPVLASYFCLSLYQGQSIAKCIRHVFSKQSMQVLLLLTLATITLAIYLTLPWPTMAHPLSNAILGEERIAAIKEFVKIIFSLPQRAIKNTSLYQPDYLWRHVIYPTVTRIVMWSLLATSLVSTILIFCNKKIIINNDEMLIYKKSLVFLYLSSFIFMILPITWGMGLPWHISLTLLCLSLVMGFSCEYLTALIVKNKQTQYLFGISLALLIGMTAFIVNNANINFIKSKEGFALSLARNAVLNPPDIKNKLDAESVVVVEDSILHDSYPLGNGGKTFLALGDFDYDILEKTQSVSFLKYQALYNGHLFKWAYLMPALQEEMYPFQVQHMEKVPSEILYNWLQHYNNIFCVGYDKKSNWHELTAIFKKNILKEKAERMLIVHQYEAEPAAKLSGKVMYTKKLGFPDHQLCQYECDQNVQCKGFTYENVEYHYHSRIACQFYDTISLNEKKFCASCIGFTKIKDAQN